VLGAASLVLLAPFFERVLNFSTDSAFTWRLIAFGGMLVLMMMYRPQGIFPAGASPGLWFAKKLRRKHQPDAPSLEHTPAPRAPGRLAVPYWELNLQRERAPNEAPHDIILAARGLC